MLRSFTCAGKRAKSAVPAERQRVAAAAAAAAAGDKLRCGQKAAPDDPKDSDQRISRIAPAPAAKSGGIGGWGQEQGRPPHEAPAEACEASKAPHPSQAPQLAGSVLASTVGRWQTPQTSAAAPRPAAERRRRSRPRVRWAAACCLGAASYWTHGVASRHNGASLLPAASLVNPRTCSAPSSVRQRAAARRFLFSSTGLPLSDSGLPMPLAVQSFKANWVLARSAGWVVVLGAAAATAATHASPVGGGRMRHLRVALNASPLFSN